MTAPRLLLAAALLALSGCAASYGNDDDEGWRPFRAGSPIFSSDGTLKRQPVPSGYGSSLTVPRVIGTGPPAVPMQEEDGNIWPEPEAPRTTLTDPSAVASGVPTFRPQGRPPQPAPDHAADRVPLPGDASLPRNRPGAIIRRPDGLSAVEGAGTQGVWTYEVPGRPGVGTALPDGRGGRILVEPGGGTVIAPR